MLRRTLKYGVMFGAALRSSWKKHQAFACSGLFAGAFLHFSFSRRNRSRCRSERESERKRERERETSSRRGRPVSVTSPLVADSYIYISQKKVKQHESSKAPTGKRRVTRASERLRATEKKKQPHQKKVIPLLRDWSERCCRALVEC